MTAITPDAAHIFTVTFHGGFASYTMDAFLVRHTYRLSDVADDFTCHAADDGRFLGWGDTKDDAVFAATCALAPEAERRSVEAGLIEYPYGPKIKQEARA